MYLVHMSVYKVNQQRVEFTASFDGAHFGGSIPLERKKKKLNANTQKKFKKQIQQLHIRTISVVNILLKMCVKLTV
jgi:hypothetical protein